MHAGDDTGALPTGPTRGTGEVGSRLVARNGLLAATQVGLISIGYLVAYRVMGATVGLDVIGAWSLCLALGSVATLADLGVSDGLARSVAQRAASSDKSTMRRILVTGLLCSAIGPAVGVTLCYLGLSAGLPLLFSDPATREVARSLLVPAMAVSVLNTLGLSCQGVLEGLEKYHLRFAAAAVATTVFVVATIAFVPRAGVTGVVCAYAAQACTIVFISLVLCLRLTRTSDGQANHPSIGLARELVKVGLPIRATGLVTVALDPLTRVAVTYFGGATSAGLYEVASRLVLQLRTLIVAGFQAVLPRLVKLAIVEPATASRVEQEAFRGGLVITVAAFTMAALMGPAVFEFILGTVPPDGLRFFVLLCIGWCVNAISAPYFFSLVSRRRVAAIWWSSGVMALTNVMLFGLLGRRFGAQGVVASLATAIAAGSAITILAVLREGGRPARVPNVQGLVLVVASLVVVAVALGPVLMGDDHAVGMIPLVFLTVAYAAVALVTFYFSGSFRR
jgi:O-antigen/teichoic acid export membrane protein